MGYVLAPLAKAQGFCDKKAWVKIAGPPSANTVPVRDQLSQKTRRQLFARIDEEIGRGLSNQNICLKLATHFFQMSEECTNPIQCHVPSALFGNPIWAAKEQEPLNWETDGVPT